MIKFEVTKTYNSSIVPSRARMLVSDTLICAKIYNQNPMCTGRCSKEDCIFFDAAGLESMP